MGVNKCYDRWQIVVVLEDVGEVSIRFTAFIRFGMQWVAGVVDCVDCGLPSAEVSTRRYVWIGVAYSGRNSATQSVFSCWSLPITTILSCGADPSEDPVADSAAEVVAAVVAEAGDGPVADAASGPP